MIKSLLLNLIIIGFIVAIYYFNLFEILTSNAVLWILFGIILILFAVAFKILGNPFKKIEDEADDESEKEE